jgi:pyridoxamine 5'-phosphate oxidase
MQFNDLPELRKDYIKGSLDIASINSDPIIQFGLWMEEAIAAKLEEPTAVALATADASGRPSVRMVLLKGFDQNGFVFFTNYESRKGREIFANPFVALAFHWKELERQVRVEGEVSKVPDNESDEYFNSRPIESRAGAIVSPQSQVITGREELEKEMAKLISGDRKNLSRPVNWGGYRVYPEKIEFWQGRPGRLHDRILFTKQENGWKIERLAP